MGVIGAVLRAESTAEVHLAAREDGVDGARIVADGAGVEPGLQHGDHLRIAHALRARWCTRAIGPELRVAHAVDDRAAGAVGVRAVDAEVVRAAEVAQEVADEGAAARAAAVRSDRRSAGED